MVKAILMANVVRCDCPMPSVGETAQERAGRAYGCACFDNCSVTALGGDQAEEHVRTRGMKTRGHDTAMTEESAHDFWLNEGLRMVVLVPDQQDMAVSVTCRWKMENNGHRTRHATRVTKSTKVRA